MMLMMMKKREDQESRSYEKIRELAFFIIAFWDGVGGVEAVFEMIIILKGNIYIYMHICDAIAFQ